VITATTVAEAGAVIGPWLRRTPVLAVDLPTGDNVVLKLENLQHAGSFKPRGAFWSVLSQAKRPLGLVAASGGNHGLAAAHVGHELGIATQIFVPTISSPIKVAAIRALGAHVTQTGSTYAEALAASQEAAATAGVLALHAYDSVTTVTGQGTLALELVEQVHDVDTVVVAVGGGGLAAGLAAGLPDRVRLVAVETEGCRTYNRATAAGRPVPIAPSGIAADALGASQIGSIAFDLLQQRHVESIYVSDDEVSQARRWLWRQTRVVAEPAGAVALAAVLEGMVEGEQIAVVVCGGNTDPSDLAETPS